LSRIEASHVFLSRLAFPRPNTRECARGPSYWCHWGPRPLEAVIGFSPQHSSSWSLKIRWVQRSELPDRRGDLVNGLDVDSREDFYRALPLAAVFELTGDAALFEHRFSTRALGAFSPSFASVEQAARLRFVSAWMPATSPCAQWRPLPPGPLIPLRWPWSSTIDGDARPRGARVVILI
jgi:hypothetical protein